MDQTCFVPNCQSKTLQVCLNGENEIYLCKRHLQDLSSNNHNIRKVVKKEHADSIAYIHQKNKELEVLNEDLEGEVDCFVAPIYTSLNSTQRNIKIISDIKIYDHYTILSAL